MLTLHTASVTLHTASSSAAAGLQAKGKLRSLSFYGVFSSSIERPISRKATVRVRVRALLVVWPPLTYIELRVRVRGYDEGSGSGSG